jgi:CxxC motif-containing protein (DUF1111 family)
MKIAKALAILFMENNFKTKLYSAFKQKEKRSITYTPVISKYADGSIVTLQKPTYQLIDLAYRPLSGNANKSPRIANQMIGLGLLDAIPESTLIALADPTDTDGDGVS